MGRHQDVPLHRTVEDGESLEVDGGKRNVLVAERK